VTTPRPIRGFATICCLGEYRAITAELIDAVMDARLYDRMESLELAVLGSDADQEAVLELIRPFEKLRIRYRSSDVTEYEFPALGLLQDTCSTWSGQVFYMHTKGVSHPRVDQHSRYWRALMVDRVLRNHVECTRLLADHDTVGTNWWQDHYSGNFWWARSEHIERLPDIRSLMSSPRRICNDAVWNSRLQCEFWLGMVPGRFASMGVNGLDLYQNLRWATDAATVVNDVLMAFGGDRYAEIVTSGASPYFDSVIARVKDSFVELPQGFDRDDAYDVVLVDGWHEEEQCAHDIATALGMLRDGGALVVHDTNPPTQWHQRSGVDYVPGTEWNGTAWRAVHRFRQDHPDIWLRTVDTDWGCTVIIPGMVAFPAHSAPVSFGDAIDLPELADVDWEWFELNREAAVSLVSCSRFRRDLYAVPYLRGDADITRRSEILNCLISLHGLDRYLEIGVAGGENFEAVIAPLRQSVDPHAPATFPMTSDAFFASGRGCPEYDLIFIDGLHEEVQALRDMENALARLSTRGYIVLHDANPPTRWHQRPESEYQQGEDWNGTVWKAIVRFRLLHPELSVVTMDVDWGCTVIRRGPPRTHVALGLDISAGLTWDLLDTRRAELLNLKAPVCAELL
jgi:predicted O-methyltransferase YrrM